MKTVKAGPLKRIHVNGTLLRKQRGKRKIRPIAVRYNDRTYNASSVDIRGPSSVMYSEAGKVLGRYVVKVWIETESEVAYA